jgi:hypothetical protein
MAQVPNLFSVFDAGAPATEVKVSFFEKLVVIGCFVLVNALLILGLLAGYMRWL